MVRLIFVLMLLAGATATLPDAELAEPVEKPAANVALEVHHVESAIGVIRVVVFEKSRNKFTVPIHTFSFSKEDMVKGRVFCDFYLSPGQYAFSVFDDENGDNMLDANLLGDPEEGIGFSNDAPLEAIHAPDFELCKRQISAEKHHMLIKMRYP